MGQISKRDAEMKKSRKIEEISFSEDKLLIRVDGQQYSFKLVAISKKLAGASKIEREKYEISPSGYGIHWPMIDEDLSVDGLLEIKHKPSKIKESIST
jgi:hypothetical protein